MTTTRTTTVRAAAPIIDFTPRDVIGRRILFTPGPVSCTRAVLQAGTIDVGAWNEDTFDVVEECRRALLGICGNRSDLAVTLLPGSGTYAVEAIIGTFVPRDATLIILSNGVYGERLVAIAAALSIDHAVFRQEERTRLDPKAVDRFLAEHPGATHVAMCHCETTTGVLNRLDEIGPVVARHGKRMIVDTMATLAGYDIGPGRAIDFDGAPIDHVVTSANKCIQGIPGMCCIISRVGTLEAAKNSARSMSLDVVGQWNALKERRRFRFTPPTHVLLAMHQALMELEEEGLAARVGRYRENARLTVERFGALGLTPYIDEPHRSHVNTTFRLPEGVALDTMITALRTRGFILFPTQVTREPTLRVGSIGAIGSDQVNALADAVGDALDDLRA